MTAVTSVLTDVTESITLIAGRDTVAIAVLSPLAKPVTGVSATSTDCAIVTRDAMIPASASFPSKDCNIAEAFPLASVTAEVEVTPLPKIPLESTAKLTLIPLTGFPQPSLTVAVTFPLAVVNVMFLAVVATASLTVKVAVCVNPPPTTVTVASPGLVPIAVNSCPLPIITVFKSPVNGRTVGAEVLRTTPSDAVTTSATPEIEVPEAFFNDVAKVTADAVPAVVA